MTGEVEVLKSEPWTRIVKVAEDDRLLVRKTYRYPLHRSWRTLLQRSRAEREALALKATQAAGICCLTVVRFGTKRRLGGVVECWITTVFEPDCAPFRDYLHKPPETRMAGGWPRLRRRLGRQAAALLKDLHGAGVLWLTVTPRNVLVRGRPEDASLLLCDMPKAIRLRRNMWATYWAGLDLFDMCFASHRRLQFTRTDRLAMLIRYCGGDRTSARRLWRALRRRTEIGNTFRRRLLTGLTRIGLVPTAR
ncbi:MAG: lipopolysaccharide kinase InaA family protein [Planctomycetota bacterium]